MSRKPPNAAIDTSSIMGIATMSMATSTCKLCWPIPRKHVLSGTCSERILDMIKMSTTTADCRVNVLRRIFSRMDLPDLLVSDNGRQFISEIFQVHAVQWNTSSNFSAIPVTSAPYNPRINELAERLVQTLRQSLRASNNEE